MHMHERIGRCWVTRDMPSYRWPSKGTTLRRLGSRIGGFRPHSAPPINSGDIVWVLEASKVLTANGIVHYIPNFIPQCWEIVE